MDQLLEAAVIVTGLGMQYIDLVRMRAGNSVV